MRNNNPLYSLIKQKSQQKGRPLKIISDWDDCLQPGKPKIVYDSCKLTVNFEKFFEEF